MTLQLMLKKDLLAVFSTFSVRNDAGLPITDLDKQARESLPSGSVTQLRDMLTMAWNAGKVHGQLHRQ